MALTDKLTAIANAIRAKTGSADSLTLDAMPTAISEIQSSGGATEPYIEETYDSSGNLIGAKMHGHTEVRTNAFTNASTLESINFSSKTATIKARAFYNCLKLALTSFPSGITSIDAYAFYNCQMLALASLPSGVESIGMSAFYNCTGLTSITFEGTPTSIISNAFQGCTNLTTINVPWAEGEVANAPWGATNATINYNYTGA